MLTTQYEEKEAELYRHIDTPLSNITQSCDITVLYGSRWL